MRKHPIDVSVEADRTPPDRKGILAATLGLIGFVLIYIWDDAIFAAPILASVKVMGALPTFLVFSIGLGLVNFVGGLLAVRAYDHMQSGQPSRLERWLNRQTASTRGQRAQQLLNGGKLLGFVASSFLLGGVVTTWIVRYSGRRERIHVVAFASATIFAISFVGVYSGVGRLIFDGVG